MRSSGFISSTPPRDQGEIAAIEIIAEQPRDPPGFVIALRVNRKPNRFGRQDGPNFEVRHNGWPAHRKGDIRQRHAITLRIAQRRQARVNPLGRNQRCKRLITGPMFVNSSFGGHRAKECEVCSVECADGRSRILHTSHYTLKTNSDGSLALLDVDDKQAADRVGRLVPDHLVFRSIRADDSVAVVDQDLLG